MTSARRTYFQPMKTSSRIAITADHQPQIEAFSLEPILSYPAKAGIQQIPKRVSHHVERENEAQDGQPGERGDPPLIQIVPAGGDH